MVVHILNPGTYGLIMYVLISFIRLFIASYCLANGSLLLQILPSKTENYLDFNIFMYFIPQDKAIKFTLHSYGNSINKAGYGHVFTGFLLHLFYF